MPLIPVLGRQKQESNHKSEASPVFIVTSQLARSVQRNPVSEQHQRSRVVVAVVVVAGQPGMHSVILSKRSGTRRQDLTIVQSDSDSCTYAGLLQVHTTISQPPCN